MAPREKRLNSKLPVSANKIGKAYDYMYFSFKIEKNFHLFSYIRFLSTTLFTRIALCSLYNLQTTEKNKIQEYLL